MFIGTNLLAKIVNVVQILTDSHEVDLHVGPLIFVSMSVPIWWCKSGVYFLACSSNATGFYVSC